MYFATGAALTAALNALPTSLTGTYKAFDAFYYADKYMGSYTGTLSPIEHFVQIGAARGYKPNTDFDPTFYQARYSDLANLDAADLLFHYVKFGLNEGRPGNATLATYNWASYLTAYPDVAKYVNDNLASFGGSASNGAIAHYVKFGAVQGFTVPGSVPAQTFMLTTSVDNGSKFTGGSGNDTFVGIDQTTGTTVTTGDSLDGGTGTDTLSISASTGAAPLQISTVGIENLSLINNSAGLYTVDSALMTGLTNVTVSGGLNAVSVTNAQGIVGASLISTNKDLTLGSAAAAVVGKEDSTTVTLNGAATTTAVTLTYPGIETINVVASGAASGSATLGTGVTLSDTSLEKVVVTGDKAVSLTATLVATSSTGSGTFDASAATGAVTANLTAPTASGKMIVTGGKGADVLNVGTLTDKITVVGGDGIDTLVITGASNATTGAQVGANVSGIEIIKTSGSVDMRALAATASTVTDFQASGTATISKVAAATTNLTVTGAATTQTFELATDTAADVLNVTLKPTANSTTTLASATVDTLNITSSGGSAVTSNTVTIDSATVTKVTASGTVPVSITDSATSVLVASINGSAHTGSTFTANASASTVAVTITGGAGVPASVGAKVNDLTGGIKNDSITGGLFADSIDGGTGNDTIIGGGGNDTLTGGLGNDVITAGDGVNSISGGAGDDSITSGSGNDFIDLGAGNNTVVAGGGDDLIGTTSVSDTSNVDGGTGADVLSAVATAITATSASGVNSAFISTSDAAPTIAGVETIFVGFNSAAGTTATPAVLDLTKVTGVTTLNLEANGATNSVARITKFAGSTINMYGQTTTLGAVEDLTTTISGTGQAALSLVLQDYDAQAAGTTTVTGVTGLTVSGKSTSQFTGNADQGNSLASLVANTADSLTISTTGSAAVQAAATRETQTVKFDTANAGARTITILGTDVSYTGAATVNPSATALANAINGNAALNGRVSASATTDTVTLTYGVVEGNSAVASDANGDTTIVDNVAAFSAGAQALQIVTTSASAASTIALSTGVNDTVYLGTLSSTGGNAQNLTITQAVDSSIGLGRVNLGSATLVSANITLGDNAILTTSGATGGVAVDFDFNSVTALSVKLGAAAKAKLDFTGETITAGTFDLSSTSELKLGAVIGTSIIGSGTSSYTFTGRGQLLSSTGDHTFVLGGTSTTFNTSGLTVDTGAFTITTDSGRINVTTGIANDNITGGTGNDVISAGAGNNIVDGGTGDDTITTGAGDDAIIAGTGADTITAGNGADSVTIGAGLDVVSLTETAAAADTLVWSTAFAAGATNAATVTGFAFGAGADLIDITVNLANGTTAATAALVGLTPAVVASNGTATANDVIFTLTGAGDLLAAGTTIETAIANAVIALTSGTDFSSANIATADSLILQMNDGTNTFLFHYVADGTAATTAAADLSLIGVFSGTTVQALVGDLI